MFIWNDYQESYDKKYNMFNVNRQYREKSFKNDEEYLKVQHKLAEEIAELDRIVGAEVEKVIHEAYPDIEVIQYDSRMNSSARLVLGRVLTRGIPTSARTLEVAAWFERKTAHKVHVDRIEDFSEEEAKKILEECTKR